MTTPTNEKSFEDLVEHSLINEACYSKSYSQDYDKNYCIDTKQLFTFLQNSQAEKLAQYQKRRGENYQDSLCKRIMQKINQVGIIDVLRKGIKDQDFNFDLYYKQPSSEKNQKTISNYALNCFSVTRQLYYSNLNNKSLDMVIFINGLPLMSFELKNQWTHQTVEQAIYQYKHDRDPQEPLFCLARCLVHFALDTDNVFMTTHLQGKATLFLPFNKGDNYGKGNPVNE